MPDFIDTKRSLGNVLSQSIVLTKPAVGVLSDGTVPIQRTFVSHRLFCGPEVIPWDGYCPNTLEELEQSGY